MLSDQREFMDFQRNGLNFSNFAHSPRSAEATRRRCLISLSRYSGKPARLEGICNNQNNFQENPINTRITKHNYWQFVSLTG
jgi:hypothetical protein